MFVRMLLTVVTLVAAVVFGYPIAFVLVHGLNPDGWPRLLDLDGRQIAQAMPPDAWAQAWHTGRADLIIATYIAMYESVSPIFGGGGSTELTVIFGTVVCLVAFMFATCSRGIQRHHSGRFGRARWATTSERAKLRHGLELGRDPLTRQNLRVPVEGNLLTIAPPRTGKTAAFILPNLLDPNVDAWHGTAVVIDPKGDAYRAAGRRRAALGRTVHCLDPYALIGGADQWNPLEAIDADDVSRLQGIASMLLPPAGNASPSEQYFQTTAATVIVATMQAAILSPTPNAATAAALTRNTDALQHALRGRTDAVAEAVRKLLEADAKTRDPILSTVQLAFAWALDPKAQRSVAGSTVRLADICAGTADLFIVTPADQRRDTLAPYLRWVLGDLFETIRRNKPVERVVVFIDEAAVLGRYDAILRGVGELPGYGCSLWTIWQTRAQMAEHYGEHGAQVLMDTAEVVTLFNLSMASPDEREHWSRALGTWTAVRPGKKGEPDEPVEQRLVPASDLPQLLQRNTVLFINNTRLTPFPILCRRRLAHRDRRLRRLLDLTSVRPVGPIRRGPRPRRP
ncbi:type IV secretory system conjugative DNA transfer family protein [Lichenihabitans sp. Uapishka_5]|uniref:type IV secretory system conjugative DNA transfer family protein n=1 Tax=Lichenihabitans sp. Uapishka_5 TaxID=3037302 RepID=UPI0029E81E0C|nr:type IV secretory system conjugative DNA transfer family protein [Lichenihabitans sp. Uapishka_5]MDX7951250.1 type IV secretory system conjugative DNA transfer family protein [Lichenihabitans sp. Uapishka_5]